MGSGVCGFREVAGVCAEGARAWIRHSVVFGRQAGDRGLWGRLGDAGAVRAVWGAPARREQFRGLGFASSRFGFAGAARAVRRTPALREQFGGRRRGASSSGDAGAARAVRGTPAQREQFGGCRHGASSSGGRRRGASSSGDAGVAQAIQGTRLHLIPLRNWGFAGAVQPGWETQLRRCGSSMSGDFHPSWGSPCRGAAGASWLRYVF